MAKRFYWLKLKEDFFRQRQIKKLRRIAGGDTYTVIYLKMLLLAMKDDGKIALDGLNFAEELALELDEEADNVKITVSFLLSCGLMEEISSNEVFVPGAIENVGSESDSAERVRKFRERQNKLALPSNADPLPSNENVTLENRDKRIEIRDKKEEKEKEREERTDVLFEPDGSSAAPVDPIPYTGIQKLFNEICGTKLKPVSRMTAGRRKSIAARWKSERGNLESFETVFKNAAASAFLTGSKGFVATFDWLLKPENFVKTLEGNYDNKGEQRNDNIDRSAPQSNSDDYWHKQVADMELPEWAK